ncbi:MAG: response regulator transcription factor [Bacteroidota bacterium]
MDSKMYTDIKVLVVDDDNLTIDLLLKPFKESGFITFAGRANTGEKCIEMLEKKDNVDLILMDINMPGKNGIKTAEELRKMKKDKAPKIVFLTVHSDFSFAQKAFDMRASLLGKNIGIDYLLSTLKRVMMGEIVINPNPNGIPLEDNNAKLKFILKKLLNTEQIKIACMVRDGKTTDEIVSELLKDLENKTAMELKKVKYHVDNQKKEIYKLLRPIKKNINAASLGAIMERSGLCGPLEFEDLDEFLPKIKLG